MNIIASSDIGMLSHCFHQQLMIDVVKHSFDVEFENTIDSAKLSRYLNALLYCLTAPKLKIEESPPRKAKILPPFEEGVRPSPLTALS